VAAAAQTIKELRLRDRRRALDPSERTGLAVLLEVARTWPASRAQTIELVLAATGGQMLDFVGARAVFSIPSPAPPEVPTIYVLLLAPAVGKEIIISSQTCLELAESAAKGLWVPYRLTSRSLRSFGLWPEEPPGREVVALVGSGLFSRDPTRAAIDSASLQNVAQLATEIALRWSKQRREKDRH
jgi:hypothetical protein